MILVECRGAPKGFLVQEKKKGFRNTAPEQTIQASAGISLLVSLDPMSIKATGLERKAYSRSRCEGRVWKLNLETGAGVSDGKMLILINYQTAGREADDCGEQGGDGDLSWVIFKTGSPAFE